VCVCVPLTNVTMVIPSQDEIAYMTFMATMYNSPSPSLRELAAFYHDDLKMTEYQVSRQLICRTATEQAAGWLWCLAVPARSHASSTL
jgi:hypothetical protein